MDVDFEAEQARKLYDAEFGRRNMACPFHVFVTDGEPLPKNVGNIDRMRDFDNTGWYYMYATEAAYEKSVNHLPDDPSEGQEAQGGPLHSVSGAGEAYPDKIIDTVEGKTSGQESAITDADVGNEEPAPAAKKGGVHITTSEDAPAKAKFDAMTKAQLKDVLGEGNFANTDTKDELVAKAVAIVFA